MSLPCSSFSLSTISAELSQFLVSVDGSDKFVARTIAALKVNDITEVSELANTTAEVLKASAEEVTNHRMSGGLFGFLGRTLIHWNNQFGAKPMSQQVLSVAALRRIITWWASKSLKAC